MRMAEPVETEWRDAITITDASRSGSPDPYGVIPARGRRTRSLGS
jgi:hypothetical protein